MKKKIAFVLAGLLLVTQGCATVSENINNMTSPPSEVEKPLVTCPPSDARPTLAVMDFEIKAGHNARRELADGLSDMLVNALVESQCFRVVERSRMNDLLSEQGLGLGGTIDQSTAAKVGNLAGAQLLVMGVVTEFKEGESGGLGGAVLGKIAAGLGMISAHVGLIVRIVDSTTGEILISKSIDKQVRKIGLVGGGSVFGLPMGTAFFKSKAMQDAVEQALIETVGIIASQKENITPQTDLAQARQQAATDTAAAECSHIAAPTGPRFMVVIPEVHITRRVPDPAGETEIIRKFLEKGFTVVDQQQIAAIRYQEKVINAVNNPQAAAALGVEFGADIIVIGEAFSEFAGREQNLFSCRARVEARVIQTSTGRILAANGTHAGGADISELVAGKAALRNAGSELADYFIKHICQNTSLEQGTQASVVEIQLTNVSFKQMQQFTSLLEVLPGVENVRKQLTGNTARIQTQYNSSAEELAAQMSNKNMSGLSFAITGLSGNKITLTVADEETSLQPTLTETEMIRQIQVYLAKLGYDPGAADGVMGRKTEAAIRVYQQHVNMTVDGTASLSLLESLKSQLQ